MHRMFKNPPNIYAHVSALKNGHFVVEDKIIFNNNNTYSLKSRECPHRGYIMQEPGDIVKTVVCKMHGFAWDNEGKPLDNQNDPCRNHFYKLPHYGDLELGQSGFLFQNFKELESSEWVQALKLMTDLEYVKTVRIESSGSYLWMMEQFTDVLHIRQDGIHPRQSLETPLDNIEQTLENGCSVQKNTNINGLNVGYWVFIYPSFAIEIEPGKLIIARAVPKNKDTEFGFTLEIQFYYSPWIDQNMRTEWEKAIDVYKEDIAAVEKIKRPFFPLKKMINKYEEQMYDWGQWYLKNLKSKSYNDSDSKE